VAQDVFMDLARMARGLSSKVMLGGWLHRHTCFVAAKTMRRERRRQNRERQATEMNALQDHARERFEQIAPILDDAINQLSATDRAAIVLRFYEGQDLRSVGQALALNEDAAQKRVARALDKLRGLLLRRGTALSGAGLAAVLSGHAVTAAPAGLASIISAAVAGSTTAAVGGGLTLNLLKLTAVAKLKLAVGAILITGVATTLVLEHRAQARLRQENQVLRRQLEARATLGEDNQPPSSPDVQTSASASLAREEPVESDPPRPVPRDRSLQSAANRSQPLNIDLPKESWAFAGYADPQSAFQSFLWASTTRDAKKMLESFAPEAREEAKTPADEQRMVEIIDGNVSKWAGVRILRQQSPAEDEIVYTLTVRYVGGNETTLKMDMKRIGSEWKYNGERPADGNP
jgi:RNA polymerase sigma factor (sigma-70 family)